MHVIESGQRFAVLIVAGSLLEVTKTANIEDGEEPRRFKPRPKSPP